MGVKLSIEKEETPRKAILKIAGFVVLALFCLALAMIVTLALFYLGVYGVTSNSLEALEVYWDNITANPLNLFYLYGKWWHFFSEAVASGQIKAVFLLPLVAPAVLALILFSVYLHSSHSFSLWYLLNHRMARFEDVQKMGLINGIILVLGRFQNYMLSLSKPASLLCYGEGGSGKTSSVAIPSILRSDNCCIIAVDNSGTLAKFTSGYRATLGKVFYFNWDLQDDPDKANYYPRWNPFGKGNMPPKGEERDEYLQFLAGFLMSFDHKLDKENYWQWLAYTSLYALMQYLTAKIAQAEANDYFLNEILEKGRLTKDDKDILLSYYALMPVQYGSPAMQQISKAKLSPEDYMPVGSWEGIPALWKGKKLSLAMMTDWLLKNYLEYKKIIDSGGDWKEWLEILLTEAQLFNYGSEAITGLQQLSYLSKKQRQMVLPMILKPMKVFRHPVVRERTSGNDFKLNELRGVKNNEAKCWEPITIYCTANTKSTKMINRLFLETILHQNLNGYKFKGPFPLLMVMDDVGQMPELRLLSEAALKGPHHKMTLLLLANSLHNLEMIYGKETLEELVANTNYKIVMGEDNLKLSRQLDKLAIFGTKSVQLPAVKGRDWKIKKGFANSIYFHRLARYLHIRKNWNIETKGYQLLLAEGYYHRPILAKSIHFLKEENFKQKALMPTAYFIDEVLRGQRNLQDIVIPDRDDIIRESGIDDEAELDKYMQIIYEKVEDDMLSTPDRKTVLAEDISTKWASADGVDKKTVALISDDTESEEDWWLQETAFKREFNAPPANPFAKK